jgi:aminoglycoside-2''-adenylyltransferase
MTTSSFSAEDGRRLFEDASFPWWVAGGRALDLFVGQELRLHDDLDIAVLRPDQDLIRAYLAGWDLHFAVAPDELETWSNPLGSEQNAVWCRPTPNAAWAFELLFNDVEGGSWMFRRNRRVVLPLAEIGRRAIDGSPYLAPEIVLLYKAKQLRPRDEEDFAATAPLLSLETRVWLRAGIERVHPGHPWVASLA